ncbi:hypothetical protein SNE40_000683 [Patella caerulea]|uniref:Uncharacterized protein n=1 Tax=Patella caerulea TaxID=87958 RepID=A0AAN8QH84_PATCE
MGRHSVDEYDDKKSKKKKKRRSRSKSRSRSGSLSSRYSSKSKKKAKKHKSKKYSPSPSYERRRSRTRSRSRERYYRSRSRSRSRGRRSWTRSRSRGRWSRSRSRGRRSVSRSRSRGRRSISPSYTRRTRSRERYRRSRSDSRDQRSRSRDRYRRSRSSSGDRYRDRKRSPETESSDPATNIPGFEDMAPHEKARIRMQLALKAAAAADEKIREESASLAQSAVFKPKDPMAFSTAVAEIEDFGFAPSKFKSSQSKKKKDESSEKYIDTHEQAMFGIGGLEIKAEAGFNKPITIDPNTLAHPNLYCDPKEKMDKWINKLASMRRKKFDGMSMIH